jgi:lipoprotein-anchoring transpeptidase ErfK/SrfK
LNPGVRLDSTTRAGTEVLVPNVGDRPRRPVQQIVVSGDGNYLHAMGADGRIAYHFPTTLGAKYDPTPQGDFRVTNVARDPSWHYQPAILENVPDTEEDAMIPPGPNNAVGVVWMALSEPHYGIHGTASPETIGYASSAGCVRLTNWDALTLAGAIRAGVPVRFRDIAGREGAAAGADSTRTSGPSSSRRPSSGA